MDARHYSYSGSAIDVSTAMEIKINGQAVTISGSVSGYTFTTYVLGDVTLAANNTMEVKNVSGIPSIDFFKFQPNA